LTGHVDDWFGAGGGKLSAGEKKARGGVGEMIQTFVRITENPQRVSPNKKSGGGGELLGFAWVGSLAFGVYDAISLIVVEGLNIAYKKKQKTEDYATLYGNRPTVPRHSKYHKESRRQGQTSKSFQEKIGETKIRF